MTIFYLGDDLRGVTHPQFLRTTMIRGPYAVLGVDSGSVMYQTTAFASSTVSGY